MWIARNEDGKLYLHLICPFRDMHKWEICVYEVEREHSEYLDSSCGYRSMKEMSIWLSDELFPQFKHITWEDEPIEVQLIITDYLKRTICPNCNKELEYRSSDIQHKSIEYPWSGYTEESEWITCPHCKKDIRV